MERLQPVGQRGKCSGPVGLGSGVGRPVDEAEAVGVDWGSGLRSLVQQEQAQKQQGQAKEVRGQSEGDWGGFYHARTGQ